MYSVAKCRVLRIKVLASLFLGFLIFAYFDFGSYLNLAYPIRASKKYFTTVTQENVEFPEQNLLVDGSLYDEDELMKRVQESLPSLPILYWNEIKNKGLHYKNGSCAKYPDIYDIQFENFYWQTLRTSWGTFQLFNAYHDVRSLSTIGPAIRIIAMIDRMKPTVRTHCHIWFENKREPTIVKTWEYKYIWYEKWGNVKPGIYQPYLVTCRIPQELITAVPMSVSLVENPCDNATNSLRVIHNKPEENGRKGFAVCVKGLDFLHEDISVRLVEWIELLGLLGAEKIFFYKLQVHPNISKVLDYYERRRKIEVTPLTLPGGQPNLPTLQHMYLKKKVPQKRQNELIPYNDCLYKNLYTYDYLTLLDTDEIIMPIHARNWEELMDVILKKSLVDKNEKRASYVFQNVYFLDELSHAHGWFEDIPKYLHMLQHVYRTVNFTKPNEYVKCFHDPQRVLTLHNHFPLACLGQRCSRYNVETSDGQLQHYRADCVTSLKKICPNLKENSINDTTIWKYKTHLIQLTTNALSQLGFLNSKQAVWETTNT